MQSIGAVAIVKNCLCPDQRLCGAKLYVSGRGYMKDFSLNRKLQKTGSFKFRGATAKLSSLGNDVPVITASSGNHGLPVLRRLCSGACFNLYSRIRCTGETLENPKLWGQNHSSSWGFGRAERHARTLARRLGLPMSPPTMTEIIAGQGTIGIEMLAQLSQVDNVFISLGGGGLVSGVGAVLKIANPGQDFGVSALHSAALAASIRVGKIMETEHLETLADGCAGAWMRCYDVALGCRNVDDLIECSEAEITQALRALAWEETLIVEGRLHAYAGYLKQAEELAGQTSVVLLCGGNFDKARLHKILCET